MGEGPSNAKILILIDAPSPSAFRSGKLFSDWEKKFLDGKLLKAGIHPSEVRFEKLLTYPEKTRRNKATPEEKEYLKKICNNLPELNVIINMGDLSLSGTTGKESLKKWHLSLLPTHSGLSVKKAIGSFTPDAIMKEYEKQVYLELALHRAKEESLFHERREEKKKMLLNPPMDEAIAYLEDEVSNADILSVDIETGRGQVNTIGFATNPNESIALGCLPARLSPKAFHKLWSVLAKILESDQKKIYQNLTYEGLFFDQYGIRARGYYHDTMWCQKFLWPELKQGLDEVGRIYTKQPYWKDESGAWHSVRDWTQHYIYNCKDTMGTFEGYLGQREDLEQRGLLDFFQNHVMRMAEPIMEMCRDGIPISQQKAQEVRKEVEVKRNKILSELRAEAGPEFNPASVKQVKDFLVSKKLKLYKKRNASTKKWNESVSTDCLLRMEKKYPDESAIPKLVWIQETDKDLKKYLSFGPEEERLRFSINGCSDEFGSLSYRGNPWDESYDPIKAPKWVRSIVSAEDGQFICEVKMDTTESDFVRETGLDPFDEEASRRWKEKQSKVLVNTKRMAENKYGRSRYYFGRVKESIENASRYEWETFRRDAIQKALFYFCDRRQNEELSFKLLVVGEDYFLVLSKDFDGIYKAVKELPEHTSYKDVGGLFKPKFTMSCGDNWGSLTGIEQG